MSVCTICNEPTDPGEGAVCAWCERANFAGVDRRPPPQPWWVEGRLPLAPKRDGIRALQARTHTTTANCWCNPRIEQPCRHCQGEVWSASCTFCAGTGWEAAYDTETPSVVIHTSQEPTP
jgi:hypothetical protein